MPTQVVSEKGYRWLRYKYEEAKEVEGNPEPFYGLRALSSDGQLFFVWRHTTETNIDAIRRDLRKGLDEKIDDPQTAPYRDEESGQMIPTQAPLDAYKGMSGWMEEDYAIAK
jgi:hypothetical protein